MLTDYYQQEKETEILKDMYMYQDIIEQYHQDDQEDDDSGVTVSQHLAPEQYLYEFPTKTCLKALAYLDSQEEEYSFFDESSFFTTDSYTAIESVQNYDDHMDWNENTILVDDGRLSPLQLPAQADIITNSRPRESIGQSNQAVGPSSFLSDIRKHHMYYHVTPSRTTPYMRKGYSFSSEQEYCENVPMMDSDSDNTTTTTKSSAASSRIVLIKLNKHKQSPMTFVQRCPTSLTYFASDEGYDDDQDDQYDAAEELESHCVFYPLSDDDEEDDQPWTLQDQAAVKIQSLWRGYRSRCENKQKFSQFRPEQRVLLNLAHVSSRLHGRQMNAVDERLHQLEQRVRQETAMRMAFEKAMEDMTVLIDQQQKILYDRVEQEVHMRQMYEEKMNAALAQLQPLESRLRKEVNARNKMEEMMTRVLDQMQESETSRLEQAKQEQESRKLMQAKLDHAIQEISTIKKNQTTTPSSTTVRRPIIKSTLPPTIASSKASSASSTTTTTTNTKSSAPTTTTTTTIRRSTRPNTNTTTTSTTATKKSTNNNNILLERPSVVPSIRRPLLNSRTSNNTAPLAAANKTTTTTTTTSPPVRRTFLSRK